MPFIRKATFCKTADGAHVFDLFFSIAYKNEGLAALIVPRFARVFEHRLEGIERGVVLRFDDGASDLTVLPASLWAGEAPSPQYFEILPPGQSRLIVGQSLRIIVLEIFDDRRKAEMKPGLYSLYLTIDHGRRKKSSELTSAHWPKSGRLLLESLETMPVRIEIPAHAPTEMCQGPHPIPAIGRLIERP